jgi:hypothetical protein
MKKSFVFLALIISVLAASAQKNYYIYMQTDNKQAFSVKMDGKDLSSTASGYIIIPKLLKGEHSFTISFPKNEWPKQSFNILLNDYDQGYTLKNFAEKGWGLFNQQSMDIVMNGDPIKKGNLPSDNTATDIAKATKTQIVNEPVVKVEEPKEVEVPVVKVATNLANREPVMPTKPEPEVVPAVKVVEKVIETPAVKVPEKVIETPTVKIEQKVAEVPVVKVPEKIVEKVVEVPVVKVPEKIIETPVVKVPEKVVEKVIETPTIKEPVYVNSPEPVVNEKPSKQKFGKITKVSTFNDDDGITITYNIETESGIDVVPIFVQSNIQIANEAAPVKTTEKFIEHIELTNPNTAKVEKVVEKTDDPTTAKVATNNANRAPVEPASRPALPKADQHEVEKVVEKKEEPIKVEQPPVVEKIVEKTVEPKKVEQPIVEKVVEKKEEPVKIVPPIVEKITEKKEEPVVVKMPVIEKPIENVTNNPLKITEAEKSSQSSRNITKVNSNCTDNKATEEDFFKTRKKIIAEDNDDDRIVVALKQFKLKCYSVLQIKNLAIIFLTDEGKYKLVDAAYPYTHESEVYSTLEPLFTDVYYIKRFRIMLER